MDSLRTDAAGAFAFHVSTGDTTALYLASARYDDIAYFSEPVRLTSGDVLLQPILVYRTSPTGPPIGVPQRLITVARPKPDGSRDVLEMIQLLNPGPATRVSADTTQPTWRGVLPAGALLAIEADERKRSGISNLRVRYNRVFGYSLEVGKAHREGVPADWIRRQSLANAERFVTPALKELEEKILGAEDRIAAIEEGEAAWRSRSSAWARVTRS